jgi:hypothetical protein
MPLTRPVETFYGNLSMRENGVVLEKPSFAWCCPEWSSFVFEATNCLNKPTMNARPRTLYYFLAFIVSVTTMLFSWLQRCWALHNRITIPHQRPVIPSELFSTTY